jgi:hypothetical protein
MATGTRKILSQFTGDFITLADDIANVVESRVMAGGSVGKSVEYAFKHLGVRDRYEDITINAVKESFELGYGASIADASSGGVMRKGSILSKRFGEDFTLKDSVWKSVDTTKKSVTSLVSEKLIQEKSWKGIAVDIRKEALSRGTISGKIDELVNAARRISGGDISLVRDYKAALKSAERNISKLAANGAPTGYLKSAYEDVIDATKKFSEKAMTKALRYAVQNKIQYEVERVVRTEMSRVYGVGTFNNAIEDTDVVGVRSELSSRHSVEDICDFYAEADLFGMGEGIFPKDHAPPYPYHPQCMCILTPIYEGKSGTKDDFNPDAGASWLKDQSDNTRKSLMGVDGAKMFGKNNSKWEKSLNGFALERKSIVKI